MTNKISEINIIHIIYVISTFESPKIMKDIFTVHTASKFCRVTPRTIINWIEAGHIPCYKTVGGHRRMKRTDVIAFMKKHGIPAPEKDTSNRKRILVVDDDPKVIENISINLEGEDLHYEVESARNVFEAGLKIQIFKPDAVILDIKMPGISENRVCRQIRTNPDTKDTKVIVLSDYLDQGIFDRMEKNGEGICFCNPVDLSRIKEGLDFILGLETQTSVI